MPALLIFLSQFHAASLIGFVRTVLIIVVVWYLLRIAFRFLMPILMRQFAKRMEDRLKEQMFKQQQQFNQRQQQQAPPRSTHSAGTTRKGKRPNDDDFGEYVDYEEVE